MRAYSEHGWRSRNAERGSGGSTERNRIAKRSTSTTRYGEFKFGKDAMHCSEPPCTFNQGNVQARQ